MLGKNPVAVSAQNIMASW